MEKEPTDVPPAPKKSPKTPSVKKPRRTIQNSFDAFAVQCNDCLKWRKVLTEEEFEEFRSTQSEDPFVCVKLPGKICADPADIEYNSSRTWVMDKPNVPKTPKGFQRIVYLRKDFSKMDVQYVTPEGLKIRAATGMATYLKARPEYSHLSASDFCFTSPKVMIDTIPEQIEKKGPSAKKLKKSQPECPLN